jgi:dTDP-4-dehydrorhamnose reductase
MGNYKKKINAGYKNILLTGSTGKLGVAIKDSKLFKGLLLPTRKTLDITKLRSVRAYFKNNRIDAVIHCAAMARISSCANDPVTAINTNIIGTGNLVNTILISGKKTKKNIRVIHISTDGVFPGTKGPYNEKDPTIPYNNYGWTKLGAECAVNLLKNFCIIRTNFFDPENIKFNESAKDIYTSKMQIHDLVKAIKFLLESDFIGTINVGSRRESDYNRYKKFKPTLKPCYFKEISKQIPFKIYSDASLDTALWDKIKHYDRT